MRPYLKIKKVSRGPELELSGRMLSCQAQSPSSIPRTDFKNNKRPAHIGGLTGQAFWVEFRKKNARVHGT